MVKLAKCESFRPDLERLAETGQASDKYIEHLGKCSDCQTTMQQRVLTNIRAQKA